MTLVCDGLAAGRTPYLEVHNPTDEPATACVASPPHTPRFGRPEIDGRRAGRGDRYVLCFPCKHSAGIQSRDPLTRNENGMTSRAGPCPSNVR